MTLQQAHPDRHMVYDVLTREWVEIPAALLPAVDPARVVTFYWFESIQQYCTVPTD